MHARRKDKLLPQSAVGACGLNVQPENTDRSGAPVLEMAHQSTF